MGGSNTTMMIIYIVFIFAIMYFLLIRPQNKKNKKMQEMRDGIRKGDVIVTIGGIIGKVQKVKDDDITIEVGADKTKLTLKKWSVSTIESEVERPVETESIEQTETEEEEK